MYQVHCIFYVPVQVFDTLEMLWTWTSRNIARKAYIVGWREHIVSISKSCFVLSGETDVRMIQVQVLYHDVCLLFFFIEIRQVFEPVRFELGSCRSSIWCHLFPWDALTVKLALTAPYHLSSDFHFEACSLSALPGVSFSARGPFCFVS